MGEPGVRFLFDTNVLIDPLDGDGPGDVAISSISIAELAFGVSITADPVQKVLRQARLEGIVAALGPGLPFDDAAADAFGKVCALVAAIGRNPRSRTADLMIAATAYANGAGIITRNPSDFEGLDQLVQVIAV